MSRYTAAQRRHLWRFYLLMTAYVVLLLTANHLIDVWRPAGPMLALLSVMPALPLVGVIGGLSLYLVDERDEFLRQRCATAMLAATGLLLAVATVWGFLVQGGVAPQPPVYLAFPFWCIGFGVAQGMMSWRDRLMGRSE